MQQCIKSNGELGTKSVGKKKAKKMITNTCNNMAKKECNGMM
jgi:hypothetical protein